VTTNILKISKFTEHHLITKKHTMYITFAKRRIQSSALLDDFWLDPVTIFSRPWYHVFTIKKKSKQKQRV